MIGILSWSGPEAWLDFVREVHKFLQERYNASDDKDYPRYILYNRPLEWFWTTGIVDRDVLIEDYRYALGELNDMGVDSIVIACNTLHLLLDDIDEGIRAKIISIIDVVADSIVHSGDILMLCSHTSRDLALYDDKLIASGVRNVIYVDDNEQALIDQWIYAAMWAKNIKKHRDIIEKIMLRYCQKYDISAIVLWCTEIPLLISDNSCDWTPIMNATKILAEHVVQVTKEKNAYATHTTD